MYRKKIKKDRVDICNICGKVKPLTWEHVPPQCCDNNGEFKINKLFNIDNINEKLDSQNGIKYRTLCDNCNNNILGANADIAFEDFYKKVKLFCQDLKKLTDEAIININLVQVLKCLFGKLLAMDEFFATDNISKAMREFILEDKIDFDNLHVYFWIYPYNTSIQARLHVSRQVGGIKYNTEGLISLLYFYPLAFVVSSQKEKLIMVDLMSYVDFENPFISLKISPMASINPFTNQLLPFNFLDVVDDGHMIMTSEKNNNKIARRRMR